MAVASFKDLCLDAGNPARLGAFWAAVLGRTWEAQANGEGLLTGPTPQHTIWVNRVPEAKTVKHRVHLDIYARDLAGPQGAAPGPCLVHRSSSLAEFAFIRETSQSRQM